MQTCYVIVSVGLFVCLSVCLLAGLHINYQVGVDEILWAERLIIAGLNFMHQV